MNKHKFRFQEILAVVVALICMASIAGLVNLIRIDLQEGVKKVPTREELRRIAENDLLTLQNDIGRLVAESSNYASLMELLKTQSEAQAIMIMRKYPSIPLTVENVLNGDYAQYRAYKPLRAFALAELKELKERLTGIQDKKEALQQQLDGFKQKMDDTKKNLSRTPPIWMKVLDQARGVWVVIRPVFHGLLALCCLSILVRVFFRLVLMRGLINPNKV